MVPRSLVPVVAVVIAVWLAVGRGGDGDDLATGGLYNGGFHRFYSNSTGDLADEAAAALHRIGAGAHAGVVERANATLARGGTVPGGQPARWRLLERLGDTDLDRFDDAWYELGDGTGRSVLARRAATYVRAHPGEFLAGSAVEP